MSAAVRRRSMTAVESVTEIDVQLPPRPHRTKAALDTVLGALTALHQPGEADRIYPERIPCRECQRLWPCSTFRLIHGDWAP